MLSRQGGSTPAPARASFAVLLAQDLAVAPLLLFVSIFGAGEVQFGDRRRCLLALANAVIALVVIVVVGRLVMRPLFRLVASVGMSDLFVATTLFVIVATGVAAAVAGFSMALGAFVAGLLLAETEFRKAIETAIDPFKGLLLGLFFFTVGMNIDFRQIARDPVWLLAGAAGLIAVKAAILILLARLYRLSWPASIEVGLLLGPGGEFAFVAIGMAAASGLIDAKISSFAIALTTLTMILTPALSHLARRLAPMVRQDKPLDPELTVAPDGGSGHAIVVGHGRVGQVVCAMLDRHQFKYVAVDNDAAAVPEQRRQGRTVFYGDATNPEFLKSCGLMEAAAVIVTINESDGVDEIVGQVRALRKDMPIVSRARDAEHARHLYGIGVTDAVPETIEASLLLSEAALIGLGVPMGLVVATIHEKRDEFRHELQQAAGKYRIGRQAGRRHQATPAAATAGLARLAPVRPDIAGDALERALDQFHDQQAAVIDRTRHGRPPLRNGLEADTAVIRFVADQDDEAMALGLGVLQRAVEQHAADAAAAERRLDRQRPEHQGRRVADADRQLPHRADQQACRSAP